MESIARYGQRILCQGSHRTRKNNQNLIKKIEMVLLRKHTTCDMYEYGSKFSFLFEVASLSKWSPIDDSYSTARSLVLFL